MKRFHILDTETVGLEVPENASGVCEISIKEVDNDGQLLEEYHSYVDPEHPISFSAMGTHHITPPKLRGAPTLEEFLITISGDLYHPSQTPVYIIAHNVRYDFMFLERYVECEVKTVDTLKLARRYFPDVENHRLQTLRYELNLLGELDEIVTDVDAHSASGDTMVLHALVLKLMEVTNMTLEELCEDAQSFEPVKNFTFGKHFGEPISSVMKSNPGYLHWVLRNVKDLEPDLKKTLEMYVSGELK